MGVRVGVLVVERGRGAFSWRVAVASVAEGSLFDELRVEMNSARARTTPVTNEFMAPAYVSRIEQQLSTGPSKTRVFHRVRSGA